MKFLKTKMGKVWLIITSVLLVIGIVANIVLTSVISGVMDAVFGGDESAVSGSSSGDTQYYKADEGITDKASAKAAGDAVNQKICEEGITLLKNDGVLPISTSSNTVKVSVFGRNSVDIAYGSSGSVSGSTADAIDLYQSLQDAGFKTNPTLRALYQNCGLSRPSKSMTMSGSGASIGFPTAELATSKYTDEVKKSFSEYDDVALVVLTRTSGEQNDMPTTMKNSDGSKIDGAASADDHYLELDQNEQDMLQLACENFDNVVLIINSSVPLELGFLDSVADNDATMNNYDYASHVKAALWIGMPGEKGLSALGKVLNGEVNPSGRTVDTYSRDFLSIPSVVNFASDGGTDSDNYLYNGSSLSGGYFTDYEEGIYIGYKYYETRYETDGEEWYTNNVVYPFGYGLSYTTFSWEFDKTNLAAKLEKGKEVSVNVTVTNTGSVSGKDVVELFIGLPYYDGEIEKASKVLVDFTKTKELAPGEKDTVTLTFDPYDIASYDYNDANKNGFSGYELERGNYTLYISKNAHEAVDTAIMEVGDDIKYEADSTTGTTVGNLFDDIDDQLGSVLSRSDWEGTYPQKRTQAEKTVNADFAEALNSRESGSPINDESEVVKANSVNRPAAKGIKSDGVMLYDFINVDDDKCDWDALIKKLTFKQMYNVISTGAFGTAALENIGKLDSSESDGPSGFVNFMSQTDRWEGNCFYCSECVLGATWNKDLAHEMGNAIGNEGLYGYMSYGMQRTYSGWYAPGVNIHRTPFGGRNPEYYSEDSIFSGYMAAEVIEGAQEKGVYCYLKHFAVNEQETNRNGVCNWLTEQALREIYLRPFEIAVKDGGSTAIMSTFTRLGTTWGGGDYRLLTKVLREEWGFNGTVICDFASQQSYMDLEQMLYAGGDLWLDTLNPTNNLSASSPADVYVMQEAMKHILYTQLHSNNMNGLGTGIGIVIKTAKWKIVMICVDVAVVVALAAWGVFVIIRANKIVPDKSREKAEETEQSEVK